jgi:tetratricopeptide (TPR) repeat protein
MNENGHVDDEDLIDYADDPASVRNRGEVEEHLRGCDDCRRQVDEHRLMIAALRQEETWRLADGALEDAGPGIVRDFEQRLAAEDTSAERALRPLISSKYIFMYANVAHKKGFRTGGVVRLLCTAAYDEVDRDPVFGQALAEAATLIAEALADDYYPAQAVNHLRGAAWKEYATACRFLGDFDRALDALDRAERAYRRLIFGAPSIAVVNLARGGVLWKQQRYPEALSRVRESSKAFSSQGNEQRYFEARQLEAVILHRMGDVAAALETYELTFKLAENMGDPEMQAQAAQNLGVAYVEGGNIGLAMKYFLVALQLNETLGRTTRAARTRWSIADLHLVTGNFIDGEKRLRESVFELASLGMASDAALAKLSLAEALHMLGRDDEVVAICSELVSYFREARMVTGALTAVSFLKEAAAARRLTRRAIVHVREYLSDLQERPALVFAPPADEP